MSTVTETCCDICGDVIRRWRTPAERPLPLALFQERVPDGAGGMHNDDFEIDLCRLCAVKAIEELHKASDYDGAIIQYFKGRIKK